jgi:hypothetical protein
MISSNDVRKVASDLNVKLTEVQVQQILTEYPDAQEQDPSGTWDLVVENLIFQVGE